MHPPHNITNGKAHAAIKSRLRRTREEDLGKIAIYPLDYVSDLKGEVSVERLFLYVAGHFEEHERALKIGSLPPFSAEGGKGDSLV